MSDMPALKGADVIKILCGLGYQIIRQKGSHVFLAHSNGRATVIPVHGGETIGHGLFSKILRDIDMPKNEFKKLTVRRKK
ncbi:MAG: type II toxin-antitoxin system HicA family toxin [Nitrospinae bacterium]|nr:type II toxin-antitoxin system HicA family toxin [Nitrospinota bacterium]